MNPKVKKVLFILTFIPYALVILGGLKGAFFGATFLFSTDYGIDGFITGVFISLLCMIAFIPVIPVCIVFHLLCLLRKTVPFIKKNFAVICSVLCAIAAAVPIVKIYF
ncbi:MAG: hypothetical protein K2J76_07355 [Oscillospiraceae bacterium]|nr:hypothetical protein [Oscillospiraceae bacterium]